MSTPCLYGVFAHEGKTALNTAGKIKSAKIFRGYKTVHDAKPTLQPRAQGSTDHTLSSRHSAQRERTRSRFQSTQAARH